jgi:hypothetical protein
MFEFLVLTSEKAGLDLIIVLLDESLVVIDYGFESSFLAYFDRIGLVILVF